MSIIISDSFTTPVRCLFDEDKISFSCATAVGRAKEEYEISLEGASFEIGLNSRYLLEALKACECEKITFKFNGRFADNPNSLIVFWQNEWIV